MSGAGNDFAVVDIRGTAPELSALAKRLCQLTGADGFLAVDESEIADFRLHFYNSDGSRGEMCGNGARCVCKFAYDRGIAGKSMTVQTDAGLVRAWHLSGEKYRVQLNNPGVFDPRRKENCAYVELGEPGIPHVVTRLPELTWDMAQSLRGMGQALRCDPAFPKGANVNFYTLLAPGRVRILTYERGVEDYTLACGTGSASVAVTLWLGGQLPGGKLEAENQGGKLTVTVEGTQNKVEALYLEGPAQTLKTLNL